MEIRFTVAAWTEIIEVASKASAQLNSAFEGAEMSKRYYGPADIVTFILVSFSDAPAENARFVQAYSRKGWLLDAETGEMRRHTSIAVPFGPAEIANLDVAQFRTHFLKGCAEHLALSAHLFLRKVDVDRLSRDFSEASAAFII